MFYNTTTLTDFTIQDMTLDCNNTTSGGLIALNKVTRATFKNVYFKNVASGGWMAGIGLDNATSAVDCFDIRFENCTFDTHA